MLKILRRVESIHLKNWLQYTPSDWKSLDITYAEPFVERLHRKFDFRDVNYRVCLHVIHKCEGAPLIHPHPWPAAMKILKGSYEQERGIRFPDGIAITGRDILHAGTEYSMMDPREIHSVRPITDEVLTLMVIGPPWGKDDHRVSRLSGANHPIENGPISDQRKSTLLGKFRKVTDSQQFLIAATRQLEQSL